LGQSNGQSVPYRGRRFSLYLIVDPVESLEAGEAVGSQAQQQGECGTEAEDSDHPVAIWGGPDRPGDEEEGQNRKQPSDGVDAFGHCLGCGQILLLIENDFAKADIEVRQVESHGRHPVENHCTHLVEVDDNLPISGFQCPVVAGEIMVSDAVRDHLPKDFIADPKGDGWLVRKRKINHPTTGATPRLSVSDGESSTFVPVLGAGLPHHIILLAQREENDGRSSIGYGQVSVRTRGKARRKQNRDHSSDHRQNPDDLPIDVWRRL
jgi:hypothetical protein